MYVLKYESGVTAATFTDAELQTAINALTNVAADCEHIAARTRHSDEATADAFHQSAESYRALREKLESI